MKNFKTILTLALVALFFVPCAFSQDLHFSQFMNSPLLTNPANTGFIPQADYRLGVNYRNQWSAIMTVPYKTMSAWGDVQLFRDRMENGWMGLGGVILHDVAGSGNLTSTKVYGSIAYHQMINAGSLFSAGFNVGFANKSINVTNLKFPDQFDGKFFDNHLPTAVDLDRNDINYLDMQLGLNYAYFPTDKVYMNAGFSAMHINRPKESFFNSNDTVDNRVPVRYTGFFNGSFLINDQWILNPNIYGSLQAKSYEIVAGANAHYNLGNGGQELIGGLYYRWNDAFIPMIGFVLKDYTMTFTYDVTVSGLRNYNNHRGAYEFSLVKNGFFSGHTDKQNMCPHFSQY